MNLSKNFKIALVAITIMLPTIGVGITTQSMILTAIVASVSFLLTCLHVDDCIKRK